MLLRQGLTMWTQLPWNSICRPLWPQSYGDLCASASLVLPQKIGLPKAQNTVTYVGV